MNYDKFNQYPTSIQDEILDTLKAYPTVAVFVKGSEYRTSTGVALTASGNGGETIDWFYKNTDFYSRVQIEEFNKLIPDLNW